MVKYASIVLMFESEATQQQRRHNFYSFNIAGLLQSKTFKEVQLMFDNLSR